MSDELKALLEKRLERIKAIKYAHEIHIHALEAEETEIRKVLAKLEKHD